MPSILSTLGAGSGLDTTALIDALAGADKTARRASIVRRAADIDLRISAMAQVRSGITAVTTSLDTRLRQGGLGVGVGSADGAIGIEIRGGGPAAPFDAEIRVDQLASAQALVSDRLAAPGARVGTGTLTLALGTRTPRAGGGFDFAAGPAAPVGITITAANDSLAGLRDAINAAGTAVRAAIVTDAAGATLVLRGATGAGAAFTLSASADPGTAPGLARFEHNPASAALTLSATAGDALLQIDGVAVRRPSNVVDDLIPGTRLRLNATTSYPVSAAGRRDEAASATALGDLASALSALRSLVAGYRKAADSTAAAGPLAGDPAAAAIDGRIAAVLATPVAPGGLTLRDAGLSVARDGSIAFNTARFAALAPARAGEVETLLKGLVATATPGGISPLQALANSAASASAGYEQRKTAMAREGVAADARNATYRAQLVTQYAAMERAVAASKSTGSFLDNQIKAWNRATN